MKVIKRDNKQVDFQKELIYTAVELAAEDCGYNSEDASEVAEKVSELLSLKIESSGKDISVEEIQDKVERMLMSSKYKDVAASYIGYRHERDQKREEKSSWARMGLDITSGEDTESQRENSNVPRGSVTTQVEMVKRSYAKKFAMDFIIPKKFKKAHEKGEIHIHDCDALMTKIPNCCLMDYPTMLREGFQLGNKWIEQPSTILTTMNVLVQMVQVQSNLQFGGLTLQDLDIHLGEYILGSYEKYLIDAMMDLDDVSEVMAKERLTYFPTIHPEDPKIIKHLDKENEIAIRKTEREAYKAAKLLGYQLNTLQIRGESSPFVTISYGSSTSWEGRLLQRSILQERMDEFDKSGVQEFPKHMMITAKGINLEEGDANHDLLLLAMKTSAKTCYPDYVFPENQETHTGGSATYMG